MIIRFYFEIEGIDTIKIDTALEFINDMNLNIFI